jgi:hypothetical protein
VNGTVQPTPTGRTPTATAKPTRAATPAHAPTPTQAATPTHAPTPTQAATPTYAATPTAVTTPAHTATPTPVVTAAPQTGGGGTAGLQDGSLFALGGVAILAGAGSLGYRRLRTRGR